MNRFVFARTGKNGELRMSMTSLRSITDLANRVLPHKTSHPALRFVRIDSGRRRITVYATDLESHLSYNEDTKEIEALIYGPSQNEVARSICLSSLAVAEALEKVSGIFDEDRKDLCASHTEAFQTLLPPV